MMCESRRLALHYSKVAEAYDRHWAPVIQPMARPLLGALPLAAARNVLDLGAGTGGLLSELQRAAPQASVAGVDNAEGMLRIARRTWTGPLAVMDAMRLGLRSESVDVAVMVFMLFHLDLAGGLAEAHRVLRRGGTLGIATWGEGSNLPGIEIWTEELDRMGAGPDPRPSGMERQRRMDTPDKLAALLEPAGFEVTRAWSETATHRWVVPDLHAHHAHCSSAGRRLESLPPTVRSACRTRAEERIARLSEAELCFQPLVVFATARRA